MRKDKYIRVSTAMGVVLTGGCGECKIRRSEHCKGCRTQTILDLLDDVAKTDGVEIPQRHGRLIDADAFEKLIRTEHESAKRFASGLNKDFVRGVERTIEWVFECLKENTDTIIPAEGGADG